MATKRAKQPAAEPAPAARGATRDTTVSAAAAAPSASQTQRLLREAAWSRMFGRTESKNPFARSR